MRAYQEQKRDTRLDGIKYVLIVLVVFGHLRQFTICDEASFSVMLVRRLSHVIYLFHMPLFIMISGFFSRKKESNPFWVSIIRLIRIYLLFHIVWIAIDLLNNKQLDYTCFFYPSFSLWYIHCLILWRILLQYIPSKYLDNPFYIISISSLISILGGFIPVSNFLALQRLFTFMPLFFIGYYAREYRWLEIIDKVKWHYFLLLVPVLFLDIKVSTDILGRAPYNSLFDVIRRIVFLISSLFLSIGFIKLVPSKVINLFCIEGKNVLFYYMYHSLLLYVIALLLMSANIIADGFVLLLVFFSTLLLLFYLRKVSLLQIPLR
jgi:fucose 4-O-acetylase-like acetyltransferase